MSTPATPTPASSHAAHLRAVTATGWRSALVDGPLRLREVLVYGAVTTVAAFLLLADHVKAAGFASDDWAYRAVWIQNSGKGFWGDLSNFLHSSGLKGRPTLAVYLSFEQHLLGSRQGIYLAWAAALAIVFSISIYLVLRELGMRRLDAGLIGLLVLVFPGSDSTRLWAMISDADFAMSLALLGVWLSLRALRTSGRRTVVLRVGGLLLMVLGVTTYELTFVALMCTFVLYRTQVGWRTTLRHAVVDWVVLGLVYVFITSTSTAQHLPFSDAIDHGWTVLAQLFELIATVALPFNSRGAAMGFSVLVVTGAIAIARRLPTDDPTRVALTRWLWTALVAAIMIAASYALYAPSAEYYLPLQPGVLNRINAFGALPIIVFVYSLAAMIGHMVFRGGDERGIAIAAAAILAIGVGIDYTSGIRDHIKLWDSGYKRANVALSKFVDAVRPAPPPPHSITVMYGQPIQESVNIPVWMHYWDLNGAIQLTYHDSTLRARPAFPGTRIDCQKNRMVLLNDLYAGVVLNDDHTPYGKMYLFDSNSGVVAVPHNRAECREVAPKFVPGPMLAPDPGAYD